ncbi:MAG: DNA-processing protein DprA [Gammaproteobacteria bacterium]
MTDIHFWLALHRAPGIGTATFQALLERFGSPQAIFEARAQLAAGGVLGPPTLAYLQAPDWAAVEKDIAWLAQPGHHALTFNDPAYPQLLREIADPPTVLFVVGDPAVLSLPQIAIVGSRNPTPGGREIAEEFARHLAATGLTITSGLALGIDAASHRGALAGDGLTIAVAGTGLDRVYPARHRDLAHQIAEHGALVSEFVLGTPPLPDHFPRRNRIISGLSLGTLVVEAAQRSGSLITARMAADQGREVFAIPGSIHNPLARGCHFLIRQGAKLVETANDILEELGPLVQCLRPTQPTPVARNDSSGPGVEVSADTEKLIACLGFESTSIDRLVERSGLTAEAVSSILLVLELQGYVTSTMGGLYTQVGKRGQT